MPQRDGDPLVVWLVAPRNPARRDVQPMSSKEQLIRTVLTALAAIAIVSLTVLALSAVDLW